MTRASALNTLARKQFHLSWNSQVQEKCYVSETHTEDAAGAVEATNGESLKGLAYDLKYLKSSSTLAVNF